MLTALFSCSSPEYYLCECRGLQTETGVEEITVDTIRLSDVEAAGVECSNFSTSDDPSERVDCQLK